MWQQLLHCLLFVFIVPSIRLLESKTNVAESGNEVTVRAFLTGSLDREVTARLLFFTIFCYYKLVF